MLALDPVPLSREAFPRRIPGRSISSMPMRTTDVTTLLKARGG